MFKKINTGAITCSDGVEIQLHPQHISYTKDGLSVRIEIGYAALGKMIVYENRMEYDDSRCGDLIQPGVRMLILERIQEVLKLLKIKYKIE